jgi:hypothetical protein
MNENNLNEEVILINDSDSEILLGNFHVEEDIKDEVIEEITYVPEFLDINVHDSVMGTAVGPGQL